MQASGPTAALAGHGRLALPRAVLLAQIRRRLDSKAFALPCLAERVQEETHRRIEAPPTVRQVYALAAALCAFTGIEFPRTRADASELIEGLRIETNHPQPSLERRGLRREWA